MVVPLCGGNIDTTVLGRVLECGLVADKRLLKFWLVVRYEQILLDRIFLDIYFFL